MGKKIIKLKNIKNINNTLFYDYEVSDNLKPFFNMDNKLKIEYDQDISNVPEEITVIPFITGILPMIYLEDISVYIKKIDKDFFKAFDEIKKGYKKMLPKGQWKGKLIVEKIIDHSKNPLENSSMFFSGGVDSTSTLASHVDEKPEFILIWGSDILQNNEKSWQTAKNLAIDTAKKYNIKNNFISSNFRFYLNENALTTKYRNILPTSWWYDVQHGPALLGHVAPLAFRKKIKTHYIPSTNSIYDKNVVCASCPIIDEKMKFCGCKIIHDGFDNKRIEKVKNICDFNNERGGGILLRVCCTERQEEINCCCCEKCYRTITEIIACKDNPRNYGFNISKREIKQIKKYLKKHEFEYNSIKYWKETQNYMLREKKYFSKLRYIKWLLKFNFNNVKIKNFQKEIWNENGEKIIKN